MKVKVNKNSNTVTIAIIVARKHMQIETRISRVAPCLPRQHRPALLRRQGWGDAGSPLALGGWRADGRAALSSGSLAACSASIAEAFLAGYRLSLCERMDGSDLELARQLGLWKHPCRRSARRVFN